MQTAQHGLRYYFTIFTLIQASPPKSKRSCRITWLGLFLKVLGQGQKPKLVNEYKWERTFSHQRDFPNASTCIQMPMCKINIVKKCKKDAPRTIEDAFPRFSRETLLYPYLSDPFRSFQILLIHFESFQRLEKGWKWINMAHHLNYNSPPPSSPHQIQSLRHASRVLKNLQRFLKPSCTFIF